MAVTRRSCAMCLSFVSLPSPAPAPCTGVRAGPRGPPCRIFCCVYTPRMHVWTHALAPETKKNGSGLFKALSVGGGSPPGPAMPIMYVDSEDFPLSLRCMPFTGVRARPAAAGRPRARGPPSNKYFRCTYKHTYVHVYVYARGRTP